MTRLTLFSILLLGIIFQSYGQHWEQLKAENFELNLSGPMIKINHNLILATQGGIYKSTDNGEQWIYSSDGLKTPESIQVGSICQDSNSIYLVTQDLQIFKSTDYGTSWNYLSKINSPNLPGFDIKIHFINNLLFVSYDQCYGAGPIFYSRDGISWHKIDKDLFKVDHIAYNNLGLLSFSYRNDTNFTISADAKHFIPYKVPVSIHFSKLTGDQNTFYLQNYDTIYYSEKKDDWKYFIQPKKNFYYETFFKNGAVYLLGESEILKTIDKGYNWEKINTTGIEGRLQSFFLETGEGSFVMTNKDIYFLKRGNDLWEKKTNGIQAKNTRDIKIINNHFFYNSSTNLYASPNGNIWDITSIFKLTKDSKAYIQRIVPVGDNIFIYASSQDSNYLYKSSDNGSSWNAELIAMPKNSYLIPSKDKEGIINLTFKPYIHYIGEPAVSYISKDSGETWVVNNNFPIPIYLEDLQNKNNIIAKNENLTLVSKPLSYSSIYILNKDSSLTLTKINQSYYNQFIATKEYIFLKQTFVNNELGYSIDSISRTKDGIKWETVATFSAEGFGGTFEFNPISSNFYYSNSNFLNAIVSDDNGDTWQHIGNLPEKIRFKGFEFLNGETYGLTEYSGLWKLTDETSLSNKVGSNENSLTVYPNPCSDIIHFKSHVDAGEFSIYTLYGEKVLQEKFTNDTIDLSTLDKGIYILEVMVEGKIQRTKVMKQ